MTSDLAMIVHGLFVDKGFSIQRIARHLSLEELVVCKLLGAEWLLHELPPQQHSGPYRDLPLKFNPERCAHLIRLFESGKSIAEIADEVGCTVSTVYRRTRHLRDVKRRAA